MFLCLKFDELCSNWISHSFLFETFRERSCFQLKYQTFENYWYVITEDKTGNNVVFQNVKESSHAIQFPDRVKVALTLIADKSINKNMTMFHQFTWFRSKKT